MEPTNTKSPQSNFPEAEDIQTPPEPGEFHLDFRTRICLWIIIIGVCNFVAYTVAYSVVGGESVRGTIYQREDLKEKKYYLLDSGKEVKHDVFVYIGIHSISIWVTVAAVMLSMLTLAKDRITSTMHSTAIRGRTFLTAMTVLIAFCTAGLTLQFLRVYLNNFDNPTMVKTWAELPEEIRRNHLPDKPKPDTESKPAHTTSKPSEL